jgi:hypothetical protein
MKKIITIFFLSMVIGNLAFSQEYFLGTFTNVGNKVTVKIKPNVNINKGFGSMDFFIRYNVASTPAFTIGNVISNPANFAGLNGLVFNVTSPVVQPDGYAYIEFVFTNTINAGPVFVSGTEYEIVSFTLNGAQATANLELASDFNGAYYFALTAADGSLYDAGTSDVFYGPGFYKSPSGTGHFLPLANVPVPVKFLGFDATKKNNSAILNWSVENESALTDKYVIESGFNGIDFPNTIATVAAYNNGKAANTYSFTQDNLSAVRNSGVLYYRIKQIDKDGKFVYTPIKNVRLDGKSFAVNAYPNPVKASTKLTIDLLDEAKVIISITDASGKQVKGMQVQGFKGPNIKEVNLSNLSSGNYMLKVQSGTEIKSLPLVKVD